MLLYVNVFLCVFMGITVCIGVGDLCIIMSMCFYVVPLYNSVCLAV